MSDFKSINEVLAFCFFNSMPFCFLHLSHLSLLFEEKLVKIT